MKKCVSLALCICLITSGYAQTLDEWFNQKATQKKYLIQQIAALQVYIGYLQKGYSIARKGLNTIGNIKTKHFSLDKDFFASLHSINPKVRQYTKVADIISLNIRIVRQYKQAIKDSRQSKWFNSNELDYMNVVFEKLIEGCTALTDELFVVLAPDKLQMSDDERISRIDRIYRDMQERFVFACSFNKDARILSLQRSNEQKELNIVRRLYGNKP